MKVGDLMHRMRVSMPQDNPGILPMTANADITAYVLSKNGYSAGAVELPGSGDVLDQFQLTN